MTDFWTEAANVEVAEPPKSTYESLPDKATVICKTASGASPENVQPKLREIARKDGSGVFYTLKVPMQVIGGDAKVLPKHVGKGYFFPEFNIEAPTAEQLEARIASAEASGFEGTANRLKGQLKSLDKFPCAPELYNLILDTLAPEGETTQARWQQAAAQLKAATEGGLTLESCQGNKQYYVAAAFHACLMVESYTVIGATYTPKQKPGSTYTPQQTVGSIGSFTEGEAKRRKVRLIDVPKDDTPF